MKNLGFSFRGLPTKEENGKVQADLDKVKMMVDIFIAGGYTYFDTAYVYMDYLSELYLKECVVNRYKREEFLVADKLPLKLLRREGDQERIFQEQLRKCGVTYFDYYLLHDVNMDSIETADQFDSFGFINRMKEEGKVRHTGFSFHGTPELLDQILTSHPELDFVQLQLNYFDWTNACIQSGRCYEIARSHGKDIVGMEPIKGGALAKIPKEADELLKKMHPDWSPAAWAIRYAASKEGVIAVLTGTSDLNQLVDNTENMQSFRPLDWVEEDFVDQVKDVLDMANPIQCINCGHCMRICPKELPIPQYIALDNAEQLANHATHEIHQMYYRNLIRTNNKASTCTGCKQCEKICPRKLNISDAMKETGHMFED